MLEEIEKKYLLNPLWIVIISILGIFCAIYFGYSVYKSNEQNLINRTQTIAKLFTAKEIASLSGSENDLNNSTYISIKERMISVREINSDIRFAYLIGARDGEIFFYGDSEKVDSSDYSPPGQAYEEVSPYIRRMFETKEAVFGPAKDRWGFWTSALVPIVDADTGNVVAVFGVDIPAGKYVVDILIYVFSPLLFVLLILMFHIDQRKIIKNMKAYEADLEKRNEKLIQMNNEIEIAKINLAKKND